MLPARSKRRQGRHPGLRRTVTRPSGAVHAGGARQNPERIDRSVHEHEGWGAGSGTVERVEYRCPCGQGQIVEEHDNIAGFRDHSVYLDCDECRSHWRIVDGSAVLEPIPAVTT